MVDCRAYATGDVVMIDGILSGLIVSQWSRRDKPASVHFCLVPSHEATWSILGSDTTCGTSRGMGGWFDGDVGAKLECSDNNDHCLNYWLGNRLFDTCLEEI